MSNSILHAENELKLAGLLDEDSDYGGMIGKAVLELMEVFSKQGHSGNSAATVSSIFKDLANFQTISPLTLKDDEWMLIDDGSLMYQNKRNYAVFKEGQDGKPYYLDAIVWLNDKGYGFTGRASGYTSKQYLKGPCIPKTFYINVNEEEVKSDDWIFHIKNIKDLDEVFEFYDKFI